MSWLWRELRDGRRAPGYLVYFGGGAAAVAAVLWLHRAPAAAGRSGRFRDRASNVGPITEAAAVMAPVAVRNRPPGPEAQSYRLNRPAAAVPPAPSASAADAFDAIDTALAAPPPPPRSAGPAFAELPPALEPARNSAGSGSREAGRPESRPPALFGYRDPGADPGAAGPPAAASPAADIVPRGTLILVDLLTTVDTGNPAAVLQFAAARSLVFNHRRQLPFGTRFLGRLEGPPARDRLNLTVDTVLYPHGLELPIRASAVEADESGAALRPGVAADYVPPPTWVEMAPYVSGAFTGTLSLLEAQAERPFTVGVGGLSLGSAGGGVQAPLYQATADALRDFTQAQLKEVGQRYASHYLIPAGTACWLQLDADLDLGAARDQRGAASRVP